MIEAAVLLTLTVVAVYIFGALIREWQQTPVGEKLSAEERAVVRNSVEMKYGVKLCRSCGEEYETDHRDLPFCDKCFDLMLRALKNRVISRVHEISRKSGGKVHFDWDKEPKLGRLAPAPGDERRL